MFTVANRQTIENHARATWKQFSDGGSGEGESDKKRRVDWSDWLNDRQNFQPSQGSNDACTWKSYGESYQPNQDSTLYDCCGTAWLEMVIRDASWRGVAAVEVHG